MTTETIKSKITKLIKKAESAKEIGSLEEAATFMAKAQEILLKHNLERADLGMDQGNVNPCIFRRVNLSEEYGWTKVQSKWLTVLFTGVSKFNFCKIVGHGQEALTIVGEEHNVEAILFMVGNIVPKIHKLRLQRWKEYTGYEKKNAFARGYLQGAAVGIYAKLKEQNENDQVKYTGLTGIIKLNDALVDEAMAKQFGRLSRGKATNLKSAAGRKMGMMDGKNLQIDKGISGKGSAPTRQHLIG